MSLNSLTRCTINVRDSINIVAFNRALQNLLLNDIYLNASLFKSKISINDVTDDRYLDTIIQAGDDIILTLTGDVIQISSDVVLEYELSGVETTGTTLNRNIAVFSGNDTDYIRDSGISIDSLITANSKIGDIKDELDTLNIVDPYDMLVPGLLYGIKGETKMVQNTAGYYEYPFMVYNHNVPYELLVRGYTTIFTGFFVPRYSGIYSFKSKIPFTTTSLLFKMNDDVIDNRSRTTNGVKTYTCTFNATAGVKYVYYIEVEANGTNSQVDKQLFYSLTMRTPVSTTYQLFETYYSWRLFYKLNPFLRPGSVVT